MQLLLGRRENSFDIIAVQIYKINDVKFTMKEKRIRLSYYVLAALLPLFIFILSTAASGMLPGQLYCFIYGDAMIQYISIAKNFWRNLFSGESLIYSFSNGMGMPTMAINAYYSLSPFHALCYLIPDTDFAGFCIVCLKMSCAAVSMHLLLKSVLKTDDLISVFLSAAYTLCSFFSYFYIALCFTDMLYIMPLIVLALVRFVRTGKWGSLCIVYTYSFIVQFYCAYMMGIFSAVIFFAYAWYKYGKTWNLWKKAIAGYVICVLTAVLLASPVLLPTAYELFSMRTSDSHMMISHKLLPWTFLTGLYPGQTQEVHNDIPYMYAGMVILLLTVAFFSDKRNSVKERLFAAIPLGFLVLSSFVPALYLFMHAFDAPNWYMFRFSWMVDFCMVIIAAREFQIVNEKKANNLVLIIISGAVVLIGFLIWGMQHILGMTVEKTMDLGCILLVICLMPLYVMMLKVCNKRPVIIAIGVLLTAELFFNLFKGQIFVQDSVIRRSVYDAARVQTAENIEMIGSEEEKSPSLFFRVRLRNSMTDNASTEYGYNGIGYFCSIENEKVRNTLEKYGYATTTLAVYDYGSTGLMQMLFSQKYDVECGFCIADSSEHGAFKKNEYFLPLGYMVDAAMKDYHTDTINPFEAQNLLAGAMCGDKHDVYVPYNGECYVAPENTELIQYDDGYKVRLTGQSGRVTYMIEPEATGNVYAYMRRWGMTSYDLNTPIIYSDTDMGESSRVSSVTMPHILPLSGGDDGLYRLFVYMDRGMAEAFDYEDIFFASEDDSEIGAVYKNLLPGAMEITSFRDDKIEGHVNVSAQKPVLFTSIPYDENWQVYVDGKRAETFAVLDDAFLGVTLEEGEHEIVFRYKSKWVKIGCLMGAVGLILFVSAIVWKKKEFF